MINVEFLQQITLIGKSSKQQSDPSNRVKILAELKRRLSKQLTESELKKIWKALYYAMWSSDKYFNQQQLAQEIAQLVRVVGHQFSSYIKAMIYVLNKEWEKIDYWRINKFMLLVREIIEEIFKYLSSSNWKQQNNLNQIYLEQLLKAEEFQNIQGLALHFIQIFIPSMEKFINEQTTHQQIQEALNPFLETIRDSPNKSIREKLIQFIFEYLKENSQNFKSFNIHKYGAYIFEIAQQQSSILPANRKHLYQLAQLFEFNENNQQEEASLTPKLKKKKKKDKKQITQEVEQTEEPEQPEQFEEIEQQIQPIEQNKNGKSHAKIEKKLKKSILQQQPEEEDIQIEGLDYSEVKASPEKMRILKQIMDSVPAYLFMTPAEKRKYFRQINTKFHETLQNEQGKKCTHERKVKFNLARNQIKEFDLRENVLKISK
ncbi:hypothetical protein pb186bvf_006851 [Paramecium bursaria]